MTKQDCKANVAENETVDNNTPNVDETNICDEQTQECIDNDDSNDSMTDEEVDNSANSAEVADESEIWKDKYLRLSAEFDNYRKRTLKEKMDLISSGGEGVMKALLPTLDDVDRAIKATETATDVDAIREGISLISLKLNEALKNKGLVEIEAVGLPLDTDFHEAIAKFPTDEDKKGQIIDVVEKGYKLNDKVVRYAKVVVGE